MLSAASVVPGAGVVVGTSSGSVYLVKSSTIEPQSLSTMDSVPGQVSKPRGGGGTLYISGWGCAARTLKPLPYTRPCSADFATL